LASILWEDWKMSWTNFPLNSTGEFTTTAMKNKYKALEEYSFPVYLLV